MGKLKLTSEDCRQRDILIFEYCKKFRIPIQVSMGGGYSKRIQDIVNAHCHTYKEGISRLLR
jgi:acetoin utilization deacetylase AcuC-like enzyme